MSQSPACEGLLGLVLVQLIFGAVLRHQQGSLLGQRGHLLGAFAVVGSATWLLKVVLDDAAGPRRLVRAIWVLEGLLGAQLVLGVEAWLIRFIMPGDVEQEYVVVRPDLFRTAHVFTGSLILAAAVAVALEIWRWTGSDVVEIMGTGTSKARSQSQLFSRQSEGV